MTARNGNDGNCSIFVAIGCHGFYPSSDANKAFDLAVKNQRGSV